LSHPRTRAAAALAAAFTLAIVFVQTATPGQRVRLMLPDIRPVAPFEVHVVAAEDNSGTRYRLAFPSISENVGKGPLEIEATRSSQSDNTMTAAQLAHRTDGSKRRYGGVGTLRFERNPDHSHWHFMKFMVYELRRASDNELIGPDVKTGFCLGDRHRVSGPRIKNAAATPRFAVNCGKSKRRLLKVREGISVGWYDNYEAYLEGQYIDVTDVADGRYLLIHRSNPFRRVRETTYANNSSSALIELKRAAADDMPRVEILRRCPAKPRCG
jgi:Lysyl oxidase